MKKLLGLLLVLAMLLPLCAAMAEDTEDAFDISADVKKVEELGIPTLQSVAKLKQEADKLWRAGDYRKAAEAYAVLAKNANWLANLIAAGCEPFYGGTKDERTSFYSQTKNGFYSTVSSGERKANSYKDERNRAMTYEALCYYKLGEYEKAVPLLTKALDLIEIDQVEYWQLCTNALYDIVGIT